MRLLGPTRFHRLNEALALVFLGAALCLALSLISFHPTDPSWDSISSTTHAKNLIGVAGAWISDLLFQTFGLAAFLLPLLITILGWKWVRSREISAAPVKIAGGLMLAGAISTALSLATHWKPWNGAFEAGGMTGFVMADYLKARLNITGALLVTVITLIVSLYLVSTFSMTTLARWLERPARMLAVLRERWRNWVARKREASVERARLRTERRAQMRAEKEAAAQARAAEQLAAREPELVETRTTRRVRRTAAERPAETAPISAVAEDVEAPAAEAEDIPIRELEIAPPALAAVEPPPPDPVEDSRPPWKTATAPPRVVHPDYRIPSTALLNEAPPKTAFDSFELKETASRIKAKFDEFNVHGAVVQINPGPVVTTFEFKPEAGIKYSRITTLTEDLCLGLQAESILIERIPGKPTVGIEVPNTRREVISLRQILESEEFQQSASKLTICLGKDINGRIKTAALESMPHLLIAGSTGSGKSVMLNSLIMSVLYKSTPDDVRMILIDPKRVEMGIYEGIPHLLTPVITDAKKATNALRNAVLEMERRLKLLASQGVRNLDQYNKKIRQLQQQPRSLFTEDEAAEEELKPLPFILLIIDELADLMMLERANVEESVTRLAQMARAVGMHLVLATQRPSVDVITGLIKANFPSRISFRVATRVDSRTVLDVMGAEHLLGRGDMLFLPPGSSRLLRVHGAYVTEAETNRVVEFWKEQARPEYDQTFLIAPPADDEEEGDAEAMEGPEDPMYHEAVRVVCELGKASTSTLQRRLRLGYGRAARILDVMQRDGIIGPPDGSKPRDVLKRPDWLHEVESQLR